MKASNMIMFVVGLVLSLIIIAQLLPIGLAPILDIANVNVSTGGTTGPFGDIPGASALIPLITLIGIISVIAIIIKIVSSAISGQD